MSDADARRDAAREAYHRWVNETQTPGSLRLPDIASVAWRAAWRAATADREARVQTAWREGWEAHETAMRERNDCELDIDPCGWTRSHHAALLFVLDEVRAAWDAGEEESRAALDAAGFTVGEREGA